MKFEVPFKEIYIHLAENESAMICTTYYAGFSGRAKRFSVETKAAPELSVESETSPIARSIKLGFIPKP